MRYVKKSNGVAGLLVFFNDAVVLDGHRPSGKIDHATLVFGVPLMKGCFKKLINGGHNIPLELSECVGLCVRAE